MSEVDYKLLYEQMIGENEELRERLMKIALGQRLDLGTLARRGRVFVQDNYLVIMLALMVVSMLVSGLYTLYQDRRDS
jgi:hypothetical protein